MFRLLASAVLMVPVAVSHVSAATITITRVDCEKLVTRHEAAADVAYKPGVDVHGRKVVPADVGGSVRIEPPTKFAIPIDINLQERFGIPLNPKLFEADAEVGTVTWDNGKAWFNGQPLVTDGAAELARVCKELLAKERR